MIEHYRLDSANPEWIRMLADLENEPSPPVEPAVALPLPEAA